MPTIKSKRIYAINNKKIMSKWDYEENNKNGINPNFITQGSHIKAFFKCPDCGHKWFGEVRYANRYNGCEKCMKKARSINNTTAKLKKGLPLFKTNPKLKNEWDFELNEKDGINPDLVMAGTNKEAHWICPLGHKYTSYIISRAKKHTGCTYCSGQAILVGFNDLATTRPDLLKEWDYEKNNKLGVTPENVMRGSHKNVFWICPLGHKYSKEIKLRDSGQGCTICAKESQTSFPEQAIYFYILKVFKDAQNRYGKPEIDIFIPSLKLGIEYDGLYAHRNKKSAEIKKNKILNSHGITLIRVKEVMKERKDKENIIFCKTNSNNFFLNEVIIKIEKIINDKYNLDIKFHPNIEKDRLKIEEQYLITKKEKSILAFYPEIAKEWDYNKNGLIKPEFVSYGSSKKYYWLCPKGHSYECSPKDRVNGRGCQICSGIRFVKGVNDLKTKFPAITKYWDYEKNEMIPENIKFSNDSIFWWKCDKGHSYQAQIKTMLKYNGCPGCSNKKLNILIKGINDLATTNPNLIEEWDFDNNEYTPDCYTSKSNQQVYWKCKTCGFHWKSYINQRSCCPNCKKNSKLINIYDIDNYKLVASTNGISELAKKFNIDLNKQRGNISQICHRKQNTLFGKFILRYNIDDEFKNLSIIDRKKAIDIFLKNKR